MRLMIAATLFVVLALGTTSLLPTGTDPVECTFSNPRYSGKCVEQVAPDDKQTPRQACTAILDCLNNPRCVKNYCSATTIRGGWVLESPEPEH